MNTDNISWLQHMQQYILCALDSDKDFFNRYSESIKTDDFTLQEAQILFLAIKDLRLNGSQSWAPLTNEMRMVAIKNILLDPEYSRIYQDVDRHNVGSLHNAYTQLIGKLDSQYVAHHLSDYLKEVGHLNIQMISGSITNSQRTEMMRQVEERVIGPAQLPDYGDYDLTQPAEDDELGTVRVPTNLTRVNRCCKGAGLPVKQFGMLTAPSGVGKTTALLNFAMGAVSAGFQSLFITFEMDQRPIQERYASICAEIPAKLWGYGVPTWQPQYQARLAAFNQWKNGIARDGVPMFSILHLGAESFSPNQLRQHIMQWQDQVEKNYGNEANPRSVYVDGFDFLTVNEGTPKSKTERADLFSATLAYQMFRLFQQTEVAGWVSVQSNQKGEKTTRLHKGAVSGAYKMNAPVDLNFGLTAPDDEELGDELGMQDIDQEENPYAPTTRILNMNTIKSRWSPPLGFELEQSESLRLWNGPRERQNVKSSLDRGDTSILFAGQV